MEWDRTAIREAAAYLRELIECGANDVRTKSVYDGLLDILHPERQATRIQEAIAADAALALLRAGRDRRGLIPRRDLPERRIAIPVAFFDDRRSGLQRRTGCDRRRCC